MDVTIFAVLSMSFLLGIKHAIEPDHMIAVSTIASQTKSLWRSTLAGVFWGIGHTLTLLLVGLIMIVVKGQIPETVALSLEFAVGIMLVYLGISSILSIKKEKIHAHLHEHQEGYDHNHFHSHKEEKSHQHAHKDLSYYKSMAIGIVHGLAGSAAMVLLTMETVKTVNEAVIYILIFGLGTILGMLLTTTAIGVPFVLTANSAKVNRGLTRLVGLVSVAFGFYYMYSIGIGDGLFGALFG